MRSTRTFSRAAGVATVALLALGVAGCSTAAAGSTMTLEEAKSRTLEIEDKIASYVPAENVKQSTQNQTSKVLIPCLGTDGLSYWPGATNIALQGEFKEEAILAKVAAHFSAEREWKIERVPDGDGTPTLQLSSDKGYRFAVDYFGGPTFTIKSQSACFPTNDLKGLSEY